MRREKIKPSNPIIFATQPKKAPIPREKLFTAWKEVGKAHDFQWETALNRDKAPKFDRSAAEEMVQKVSQKLSFAPEIDNRKLRNVVLAEEKGLCRKKFEISYTW